MQQDAASILLWACEQRGLGQSRGSALAASQHDYINLTGFYASWFVTGKKPLDLLHSRHVASCSML
jgi:hypothetical protein